MKTLIEATEARISHLEQLRAACNATIEAERELLRLQRDNPPSNGHVRAMAGSNGQKGRAHQRNHRTSRPPLSSRRQIVRLLEASYPKNFDPREVSRRTGVVKRSPDGRLSTYSLLARLYQEGKIDKNGPGRYCALPPSKRARSN
jgi:hypothetical protein